MAGSTEPTAPLRRFFESMTGEEGPDVLDEVATPDVEFEAVTGKVYEGREEIKDVLAESMEAYEHYDVEIEWLIADGDRVVASTRATAKMRRGILGIPPPDDVGSIDTIFDGRLEDGKIAYLRQVFDTRQMMPVAARRGRGAALGQMRDGVVIVDDRELIVDANAAALELLGVDREAVLGDSIEEHVGVEPAAVAASTEPTEIERDDRIYELSSSAIFAEDDDPVGHTLVARDVTERKRRTRQLAEQRDELERLEDLNSVLRGVNQALVGATSRQEIDRAVCDRLADADLFEAAVVGDVQTWAGDAERWTVAGDREPDGLSVPELARPAAARSDGGAAVRQTFEPTIESDAGADTPSAADAESPASSVDWPGTWTVVPLLYGNTVYGGLGLYADRDGIGERVRAVLLELGETIGHAINAVETRRLLSAEATVALELASTDESDPLVAAVEDADAGTDAAIALEGLVPAGEGRNVAYLVIDVEDPAAVLDALEAAAAGSIRTIRRDDGAGTGLIEWTIEGEVPLAALIESGAHVETACASDGVATYEVQVAADTDVRSVVDRLRRRFPDVRLVSKAERSGPLVTPEAIPDPDATDLTQRQQEALEVAYRSGYFAWPRDSTAEEVAASLDVAPSTLHSHLRKAEETVLDSFFEDGTPDRS